MNRLLTMGVALALSASVGIAAAPGATSERDAAALILRQKDFRGWPTYDSSSTIQQDLKQKLVAAGVHGNAAEYTAARTASPSGLLQVSGNVFVLQSTAQAKKTFPIIKRWWDAFHDEDDVVLPRSSVPSFGDQQFVRHSPAGNEGIGSIELIVRKKTTVWVLRVNIERRPSIPTKAELLGHAKKYGQLQKARVGSGA